MATKRAKKKTAQKRTASRRKAPAKSAAKSEKGPSWLFQFGLLLLVAALVLSAVYYFGSFKTRAQMERIAIAAVNAPRTHGGMPAPIAQLFDVPYDWIPSSEGMVVEGGELGRNSESHFLAGVPHSRSPIRPLLQKSYTNLFNERDRQTACIAFRLDDSKRQKAGAADSLQIDARLPSLTAQAMTLGEWRPHPIAPARALISQYGATGGSEAALAANYAPMTEAFADGPWRRAMHQLTDRYPQRFGEVWIYLGPAYRPDGAKLASGVAIPDAFYAIVLDLTEAGGLRALALLIPTDADSLDLNNYLTSIAQIEKLTSLQFLPELDFSVRDTLGNYIAPSVW